MKSAWRLAVAGVVLLTACLDPNDVTVGSVQIKSPPAIFFAAIGDTFTLRVSVLDAEGELLPTQGVEFLSRDNAVARVDSRGRIRAVGNGRTSVIARGETGSGDSVSVSVAQALDSLVVQTFSVDPILSLQFNSSLALNCRVFDQTGVLVPSQTTVTSATGVVTGTSCDDLRAQHSGFDTISVQAGAYHTSLPIVLAVRPQIVGSPVPITADSIPAGSQPWAPTMRRNSAGDWELYFTAYFTAPETPNGLRGDLHRLRSSNGIDFVHDGVAVTKDSDFEDPQGTGIENIAIVPRPNGPGWRMFFAAGGYASYGWQVYSAISQDERVWTKEPGIRISNGGTFPPQPPSDPPWPVGEGIEVDQLPSGEWRMITGGYENILPRENKFQLVEWRSPDQVSWHYIRAVLTTDQVGPGASRSIYSPSIHEVIPGLYRMYFTGDNLNVHGGRSRIYTAVSLDKGSWQVEGVLLAKANTNYFYSTLVDGLLAFIQQPVGSSRELGVVSVVTR